jgi:hypothetical protein
MIEFFLALVFLLLVIAAMSVGVMMGRKPIAGSCGGVGAALGEENYVCDICGGDPAKCDEQADETDKTSEALSYDASEK